MERSRKKYKDPALFGEWLNIDSLQEMESDPQILEERIRRHYQFFVGTTYLPDGSVESIYALYEKEDTFPKLIREKGGVYYTEDNRLWRISLAPEGGPLRSVHLYEIKGDSLFLDPHKAYMRDVYKRQTITPDLFPQRLSQPSK